MAGELLEVLRFQRTLRDQNFSACPWVFFGEGGDRIKDFRGAWDRACIEAGLCDVLIDDQGQPLKKKKDEPVRIPNKLFHDFRKTAIRNMSRAGVPERVSMMVSGHKTRSVFDRYRIVNEDDLRLASQRVKEYLQEQVFLKSGVKTGHNQAQQESRINQSFIEGKGSRKEKA